MSRTLRTHDGAINSVIRRASKELGRSMAFGLVPGVGQLAASDVGVVVVVFVVMSIVRYRHR